MKLPPIAATTVGSFPRPGWLVRSLGIAVPTAVDFAFTGEALREAQDDATLISLHDQEGAGLDLITDGEQRRLSFINHILAAWDGVDLSKTRSRTIRRRTVERPVPCIVGKIQRRAPAVVEDLRFAKVHTAKPVKMAVPGPMTVIDTTFDEFYGDEEAMAMDVATALNAELLDLQAAGADVLQIDEPAMTRYHEKVESYGARALDRCLQGITVSTIVHLCYGYPGRGDRQYEYTYPELLKLLMQTKIGGFSLEFARSGYDPAMLTLCEGRLVMFGCMDPGDSPPEPVADVAGRVREALKYVDPNNLLLAPDCGLMTISRELAHDKARLVAETAQVVRQTL
jgi:5-methyltetrahydropteroyltriglutamate--homocysteine methyltransferase